MDVMRISMQSHSKGIGSSMSASSSEDSRAFTAVFGDLAAMGSLEEAVKWAQQEISKLSMTAVIDIFLKDVNN